MATTTITDLIRALETTKTMVLAVDQEDTSTGEIETKKIDLEQILNLFAVIGNEPPTGVAHIWTTDTIPAGYLELNGQTFDPNTYPQLGLIYPSGILPDWRGRVAKHTPNGQSAGTTEEDQLKEHNHVITVNSRDLGTKSTNSDSHNHNIVSSTRNTEENAPNDTGGWNYLFDDGTTKATSTDSHSHTVVLGSHNHAASCSNTGGTENRVKGAFVRYIVRAR